MYISYSISGEDSERDSILYHFSRWGLIPGDKKDKEDFIRTVGYADLYDYIAKENIAIVVLTQTLSYDCISLLEIEILKNLFNKRKIKLITLQYGAEDIPSRLNWLKDTIVYKINGIQDIINSIWKIINCEADDKCIEKNKESDQSTAKNIIENDRFLNKIYSDYKDVESFDYKSKISMLYFMVSYMEYSFKIENNNIYCNCLKMLFKDMDYIINSPAMLRFAEKSFYNTVNLI